MTRLMIAKLLILITLFMVVKAKAFVTENLGTRSLYEQYTLGQEVEGAQIVYMYEHTQSYDDQQTKMSLDFNYPFDANVESSVGITQIKVYVESSDGASTQVYVTKGGIGESNISLQLVADNSKLLHYMLVIFGKQVQ